MVDSTGLLGLALFSAFVLAVVVRTWALGRDEVVFGLGQVAVVVLITNLSTESMELMVGWLLIGLLLAATDVAAEQTRPARE